MALAVPAGVNVAAQTNNIVGFNINFKPGHKYDTSSVMIYQGATQLPAGTKRCNYFGYTFYANGNQSPYPTQVAQTAYYTNSFFATKTSSYAPGSNGWLGYIPGNAFFAHQYCINGLKLTTAKMGIESIENNTFSMSNLYPNPANNEAYLAFNLKSSSNVNIDLYNLMGQKVKSAINKTFTSGEKTVEIDLSGVKPGVYFVNMTVNGVTQTKKLTVTQ